MASQDQRGGSREGAGRPPEDKWFAVGDACDAEMRAIGMKRAVAEHNATPRVQEIRMHQAVIRSAMARHKRPADFEQVKPEEVAPAAVRKIDMSGRGQEIRGVQKRGDRKKVIATVAARFELSPDAVNAYWKKYSRLLLEVNKRTNFDF